MINGNITTKVVVATTKLVTYDKSGKCDRSSLNKRMTKVENAFMF